MTQISLRISLAALALILATVLRPGPAGAQQLGEGMDRSGTVGIQNEAERKLFGALICTCGCPREALDSCTCGFAHARRDELRAELESGKPVAQIQEEYAATYGSQALAVPPNVGWHRWVWILPSGAIVLGAAGVVLMLGRWKRRADRRQETERLAKDKAARQAKKRQKRDGGDEAAKPAHDAYEDRLEEELARLDE